MNVAESFEPLVIIEEDLGYSTCHNYKIRSWRTKRAGVAFDPNHTLGIGIALGDCQHGRRRVNANHLPTFYSEFACQQPCATPEIEYELGVKV